MKNKIINIYLPKKEKNELEKIKQKYHLSFSTIANIVTSILYLIPNINKLDNYVYKDKGYKTSIKPRIWQYENPSILYTNCLMIFLKKETSNYMDQKKNEKTLNMIYRDFQNTFEENWNGNYYNRLIPKFIRKNTEYVKKLIGEE